jgi:hypothetical protein
VAGLGGLSFEFVWHLKVKLLSEAIKNYVCSKLAEKLEVH